MNEIYTAPLLLRDLAINERPQERLEKYGAPALSDTELLAMLLRSGTKNLSVLTLSSTIIAEVGSLAGLLTWTVSDFKKIKGIGTIKALQLITVMEIARRILLQNRHSEPSFNTTDSVFEYFRPIIAGIEVEKFWVLCLNRKNRLIKCVETTSGTASSSLVHPREVFRDVIRLSASAIICVHNHPSGAHTPSSADIQVTRQLKSAAKTVFIDLLDHIVIGQIADDPKGKGYYSFEDAGLI